MSKDGRYGLYKIVDGKMVLETVVEPINPFPDRNADWDNGIDKKNLPEGGSIREEDSVITKDKFKNIRIVEHGAENSGGEKQNT